MPKPKSLNRKQDPTYKRVESYLTKETKNKLFALRKIVGLSTSEFIEMLIENEYDLIINRKEV